METYLTEQNEWIRLSAHKATVGLDGNAIKGDVVYIELPAVGFHVQRGDPCATV
jgi:glycine cleavage system H lipoate-binding protein